MSPIASNWLTVLAAYLIGSIPFAYVIVRLVKGIDIRTVGSGNVGATNAGRVLGKKGFLVVFGLDLLKGWLPTIGFPALLRAAGSEVMANLSILIAVAAIVGHNFPISLKFRGGKGVSTSLGAAIGLDWASALCAAGVFLVSISTNRYMSVSSVLGATAFVAVHFFQVVGLEKASPWDREHLPFSVLILGLYLMLIIRHRNNWRRILEGTEPKIGRRKAPPSGKVGIVVLGVLALAGFIAYAIVFATQARSLDLGSHRVVQLQRLKTGHQRAISPTFADRGKALAVLCPRYNRLMIYDVTPERTLKVAHDVEVEGQPLDVESTGDQLVVLQRPTGDACHVREGSVQAYDFRGARIGAPVVVGFYPSDLAILSDTLAVALCLNRVEGSADLPAPCLVVVDLKAGKVLSRLAFDGRDEAPTRVSVSSTGRNVAVTLAGTNQVAAINLENPAMPCLLGRSVLPPRGLPYPSVSGDEWILMPVASEKQVAVYRPRGEAPDRPLSDWLLSVDPEESSLDFQKMGSTTTLGQFPLRGSANLGAIRPTGLACSSERSLAAVTSRSGAVYLLGIDPMPRASAASAASVAIREQAAPR